jgi:hypothetical protein
MIVHVVLFRLKPGVSDEARDGVADVFSQAIREIPSIRRARVGSRVTVGGSYEQLMTADYPLAAVLEFDDISALRAYLDHPIHELLTQRFFACIEHALMYDFDLWETDEGIQRIRALTK